MFKQFGHFRFVISFLLISCIIHAKSFENFQRTIISTSIVYKYDNDAMFSKSLQLNWEAFEIQKPFQMYEENKPTKMYPSRRHELKKQGPKVNVYIDHDLYNNDANQTISIEKTLHAKEQGGYFSKDIDFDFFGTQIEFNIPEGLQKAKFYPLDQHGIKNFFDIASISEYEPLLKYIKSTVKKLSLNDWGLYLLVDKMGQKLFQSPDENKLFNWFIFTKLGYLTRIGLAKKHVLLFFQSDKIIYALPRCTIEKKNYYILQGGANKNDKVYTYKQNYPGVKKPIDLSLKQLPTFASNQKSKKLDFKIDGNSYEFDYVYNQNMINFMKTYPQADYETFFNAPLEDVTYKKIAKGIKNIVDAKHASEAIDFILKFVQKAFVYEVDDAQFGKEKVMFAQETLYYDKSDCEDRAVLFAYLVKKLLNISVVGIKYPNHMATALYIPVSGDSVKLNGKKYIVADPTYINAGVGQSMPKFRGKKPQSYVMVGEL